MSVSQLAISISRRQNYVNYTYQFLKGITRIFQPILHPIHTLHINAALKINRLVSNYQLNAHFLYSITIHTLHYNEDYNVTYVYCYRIKEVCIKLVIWNKSILIMHGQKNIKLWKLMFGLQVYSLGKRIIMTDKSLRSFSVFVRAAVKHFTRSDGANRLWSIKY